MKFDAVTCPGCGHTGKPPSEESVGNRLRIKCQKCETIFWLVDHGPGEEALEEDFRLARDTETSCIVI